MIRRVISLGLWGIGLLIMVLPTQAQEQRVAAGVWSQPEYIGYGWWQKIAVSQTGQAHMIWYGLTNQDDSLHYSTRDVDGTWTHPNDVIYTPYRGFTVRNAIVVTSDGMLHVVYRENGAHYYTRAYSENAYNADSWSTPFRVDEEAYYVSMIATSDKVLHMVFGEQLGDTTKDEVNPDLAECFKCSDVLYRRSTDGGKTWSAPVNLSQTPYGAEKVDIFRGASGRLFVIWDEGLDTFVSRGEYQDVRLIYSDDDGLTWSDTIILDGDDPLITPMQFAATELNDGSILAVWRDYNSNTIYFQTSGDDGKTWTDPEPIPDLLARDINDTPYDDYNLETDMLGVAHLFATGRTRLSFDSEAGLYHIEFRQGQWRQLQLIYQGLPEDRARPEWPKAAIGPQNDIHLTWFIRFDEIGANDALGEQDEYYMPGLAVYYSHRSPTLPDAPLIAFNPTETPPTQVAFVAPLEPTPTPYPTVEPIEPGFATATTDLYAIRVLLGGIVAVVILCAGVLVLSGFRPRRR